MQERDVLRTTLEIIARLWGGSGCVLEIGVKSYTTCIGLG